MDFFEKLTSGVSHTHFRCSIQTQIQPNYPEILHLPHRRSEDVQRSVVLASPEDVQFVVEDTDAVPESGRFRQLGKRPPLYVPNQTGTAVEPFSVPQGPAGNPLHEILIYGVPADQNQDLNTDGSVW